MSHPPSYIPNPKSFLICVGSELLRGKINTHASHLARRLAGIGLALNGEETVSDEQPEIAAALRRALVDFDVVFATGGLGPTFDDLTREAAADATGKRLALNPALLRTITTKFRKVRYHMPAANARQAYLLEDATPIANPVGTAPGQWLVLRDSPPKVLILLPGPPRELYPMLDQFVLPKLRSTFRPQLPAEAHLHFVGVPESVVDHKVRPLIAREQARRDLQVQFTILAHLGLVDLDIYVTAPRREVATRTLEHIVGGVRRQMGAAFYGRDIDYPLEKVVGNLLKKRRATLAIAESCTGGLLSARLTDIPGSSDFLLESIVSYANDAKLRELNIRPALLKRFGAVSVQIARAMSEGVRQRAGASWGMAITGIAGPGGGTPKKPVGLVYIALAAGKITLCKEFHFSGDRDAVRQRSVLAALDLLRRA